MSWKNFKRLAAWGVALAIEERLVASGKTLHSVGPGAWVEAMRRTRHRKKQLPRRRCFAIGGVRRVDGREERPPKTSTPVARTVLLYMILYVHAWRLCGAVHLSRTRTEG